MGLVDNIKKNATSNGTKIQDSQASKLEKIFNKMFYLEKDAEKEPAFVRQMVTRGLESQERIGLHASAMIVSDNKFCVRQQVLSLIYRQRQGEQTPIGLKRIFEEGNAIHEKWQRMFLRAGYSEVNELDYTQFDDDYELSFTPDILCFIPEFFEGKMVGEIKSVNTFQFKHMTSHPSGRKQMQLYMHEMIKKEKENGTWNGKDWTKGFVLCDDKNTQDFKVFVYDYEPKEVAPFVERLDAVKFYKERVYEEHKMVKRSDDCKKSTCKRAEECPMRDACWNVGMGKAKINED